VLAASAAGSIVARHGAEVDARSRRGVAAPRGGGVIDAQRVRYNPNRDEERFQAIDQILKMATLFAMLLPGAALARERERGTIEQLLVSPLSPGRILLSKILPMTLLVTVASILVTMIVVVRGFLGIPIQGQVWHFALVIASLSAAMAGIGILIATVGRTVAQVGLLAMLVLSPLMLLSGAHTPPESLPVAVRPVMYLSPLYYSIDAAMGVVLRGADLRTLTPLIGATLLLAVATSGLALVRFRGGFR
jgi:ABC-2 type transport system permease protein